MSSDLDQRYQQILIGLMVPPNVTPEGRMARTQHALGRLGSLAIDLANARWPGFEARIVALLKEIEVDA